MTIIELLDKTKERLNVKSGYALAKALEINQARITDYRKGTRYTGGGPTP